mgnify:CR=1 FL=1
MNVISGLAAREAVELTFIKQRQCGKFVEGSSDGEE